MEIFSFITGVLYIVLEYMHKKFMWVVGIISAAAYFLVFMDMRLYAKSVLQIYYFLISFYGLYIWYRDRKSVEGAEGQEKKSITYRIPNAKFVTASVLVSVMVFILLMTVLSSLTSDSMPVLDALSTTLGIVGTYWLSRSYIHVWYIWIITDALTTYMVIIQGSYMTALLYAIYTAVSVYGYFNWKKRGVMIK
ncbi:MAG: nicotinamide riboside transporter PnuC [Bacteroidales bacterium]|jgi:nicotinamide mononucleotide transporter|nr:nicotinamide riboside transporter PnuC [Bacteroidales bacterium]